MGAKIPGDEIPLRDDQSILLWDFFIPNEYDQIMAVMKPKIGDAYYEIKSSIINMLPSFYWCEKNPYKHLDKFFKCICNGVYT